MSDETTPSRPLKVAIFSSRLDVALEGQLTDLLEQASDASIVGVIVEEGRKTGSDMPDCRRLGALAQSLGCSRVYLHAPHRLFEDASLADVLSFERMGFEIHGPRGRLGAIDLLSAALGFDERIRSFYSATRRGPLRRRRGQTAYATRRSRHHGPRPGERTSPSIPGDGLESAHRSEAEAGITASKPKAILFVRDDRLGPTTFVTVAPSSRWLSAPCPTASIVAVVAAGPEAGTRLLSLVETGGLDRLYVDVDGAATRPLSVAAALAFIGALERRGVEIRDLEDRCIDPSAMMAAGLGLNAAAHLA